MLMTFATGAIDRVRRLGRVMKADSVRFVRFNMVLPSHPPRKGGIWGWINGQHGVNERRELG
jgi:hypothetical protein